MNDAIELRNATVVSEGNTILDRLSFCLRSDEHACILGPNGSGKSTLVRLIAGDVAAVYTEPPSVKLFGNERWNLFDLRYRLGIVSDTLQSLHAVGVSALEVVLSGFYGSVGLPPRAEPSRDMIEKVHDAAGRLGVLQILGRRASTLSSGELRRILVARALVHDPDMLLLDEPYSSLDLAAKSIFADSVRSLAASGHAIVLVTHDLSEISPEIERVILLKDGRVFADGPAVDLLSSEMISELYGIKIHVERYEMKDGPRYRAEVE
jgi:iron complex transport system ATP-binding protein